MCKKSWDLHKNNKKKSVKKSLTTKQTSSKVKTEDKPNNAEMFFLLNEDILN